MSVTTKAYNRKQRGLWASHSNSTVKYAVEVLYMRPMVCSPVPQRCHGTITQLAHDHIIGGPATHSHIQRSVLTLKWDDLSLWGCMKPRDRGMSDSS